MTPADPTLPTPLRVVLLALLILAASVWIGGMAAVTVLARVSGRTLEPAVRVRLFRDFGRSYLALAGTALAVTVICGAVLLIAGGWDGLATAIALVAAALALALALGVRQARAMRRLRETAADTADPAAQRAVAAGARRALALRSVIGLLSVALFVLAMSTAA